ncbi:MAG: glycerol-3-phosphate 1-O-acyltransferase PlsY [Alphaproteobacteria bacterium]|jgi:glycerol-3-phosphate acyltransferase PlsY|nr:glycerol-3-phosphate 1-O-acyltransferase PlsY [Alphaproteobacteria bacterium]
MDEITQYLIMILLGYTFGSIPFGLIFAKLLGHGDIRKIGSGNIGATNALRTGSKKLALLTLICDMFKGVAPVLIAKSCCPEYIIIAGIGAIIGHCFPIWLKFKGGKGVATTLGVLLAISPILGLLVCLTWLIVAVTFKISSLSALVAILLAPIYTFFLLDEKSAILAMGITIIVWLRHKDNIIRIIKREEKKIGKK